MKIEDVRIGGQVMTKTGRIGRVAGACDNGRVYVLFGSEKFPQDLSVCDIEPIACDLRVGDKVRGIGKSLFGVDFQGKIGEVEATNYQASCGTICTRVKWEDGAKCNLAPPGSIELVSDACESCQKEHRAELDQTRLKAFWEGKAAGCKESGEEIAELQVERDAWKRNAAYWRDGLDKLRKEALAESDNFDMLRASGVPGWQIAEHRAKPAHLAIHIEDFRKKPLSEVGKFYVTYNVDASGLIAAIKKTKQSLLSQEARRVVEYVASHDCPVRLPVIYEDMGLIMSAVLDALAEARDAGIIELVDGKYSIAGEE